MFLSELSDGIEFDSEDYEDEYDFDDEDEEEYEFLEEQEGRPQRPRRPRRPRGYRVGKKCKRRSDCNGNGKAVARRCVRGRCVSFLEDIVEEELSQSCSRPSDCPSNKKCVRGECKRHGFEEHEELALE